MSEVKKFIERVDKQIKGNKVIVVDMATSKVIMAIRNKFKTLYPMFISQIEMKDAKVRTNLYKDLKVEMKRAAELCDIMLGEKSRIATQDEIKEFVQISKSIDGAVTHLTQLIAKNEKLRKVVAEVENQTSMSVEGIKRTTKVFSENIEKKQGRHGGLLQSSSDLAYAASGFLEGETNPGGKMSAASGLLGLALGPFAPLATFGLTGAYSVFKKLKERKRVREVLGGEIGLTAKELGIDTGSLDSFRRSRDIGDPIGSKIGNPMMNNTVDNLFKQYGVNPGSIGGGTEKQPRARRQGGINIPAPNVSSTGSGRGGSDEILGAFNQFYSFGAFRAPYTKKMMEILERQHGGGASSLFGGLRTAIEGLIPKLAGFGIALAAGYALYKSLGISLDSSEMKNEMKEISKDIKKNGVLKTLSNESNLGAYSVFGHHKPSLGENIALGITGSPGGILAAKFMNQDPDELAIGMHSRFSGESFEKSKQRIEQYRKSLADPNHRRSSGVSGSWGEEKTHSVSHIVNQMQEVKAQSKQSEELVSVMNEVRNLLKKQGTGSSLISAGTESKNDPFLDLLNTGNFGEDF